MHLDHRALSLAHGEPEVGLVPSALLLLSLHSYTFPQSCWQQLMKHPQQSILVEHLGRGPEEMCSDGHLNVLLVSCVNFVLLLKNVI